MRMLVFFDLPTETDAERREYRRFRKLLIRNGFLMLQESVYCKLLLNSTAQASMAELLRKNRPDKGLVQILTITEKQFAKMEFITGSCHSDVIDTDERLVEL
ncbi:MAG: CRISPR-associated endonuclease Cas2 [Bacillota bacterium]|nr:CRISPR-associated endonuclease Cas2 [Bacillota bacterium]